MINGREAYRTIQATAAGALEEQNAANAALAEATQRVTDLRAQQGEAFEALARFHIEANGEALVRELGAPRERVRAILAEREKTGKALKARRAAAEETIAELEKAHEAAATELEQAEAELEALSGTVGKTLDEDPEHRARVAEVDKAVAVAQEARAKTRRAEEDRVEKGAPYEADPLFMYLWKRGYGTSAYRHDGIIRLLDGWVARIIDYARARPNYYMLTEIPKRLDAHADRLEEEAATLHKALAATIEAAVDAAGGTALKARIEAAEKEVAELSGKISAAQAAREAVAKEIAAFAAGEDPAFRSAVETLVAAFRAEALQNLYKGALATPSPQDEQIVATIDRLEREIARAEEDREAARRRAEAAAAQRARIEAIADEFRNRGYDRTGSEFTDGAIVGALLTELLRGALTAADYWARAERNHRWRRTTHPGFPRSWPGPGRSGGGFGRGGFGGGGFRGGGGFGGGGFRTGGGF